MREERRLEETRSGKLGLGEKKGLEMWMNLREGRRKREMEKSQRDKEEEEIVNDVLPWELGREKIVDEGFELKNEIIVVPRWYSSSLGTRA